ncbi:MAG: mechanosensitive ion channel [Symploca sp. SIO1C4]|uniref:Mechanosensitive ion channel n=1 Tax=Symploca sp. SIO1C4 TaxID=2607765 RepID=A0A6B3NA60_9CYAN|nr:mechanosensitive ion channel [Symploca sp. SIO1C4]
MNKKILIHFFLLLSLYLSVLAPAGAIFASTESTGKAPVMVDGTVILQVADSGEFTAVQRANFINSALEKKVQSGQPIQVEIAQQDGQITLRANNRYLLTVTKADVALDFGRQEQAEIWQQEIQESLDKARRERTPAYIGEALRLSIGVIGIAIAIHWGLSLFCRRLSRQRSKRLGSNSASNSSTIRPKQQFWFLGLSLLLLGMWGAVGFYLSELFPLTRIWRYRLTASFTKQTFELGSNSYSILDFLFLLVLSAGVWVLIRGFTQILKSRLLQLTGVDRGIQDTVALLVQYALTFLALLILLPIWGVDVSSLAILASLLGVGIGFGLQNIANNFISGLIITFERPIQAGDFIQVGELLGTVERIGTRSTEISTLDQVKIIVPNSRFLESEVVNWSHGNPVSRMRVPVGVAYGSNIKLVRQALLEAAKSHPDVLHHPSPQVWLQEFGDNSINFDLLVWICEPPKQFKLKSDLNYRIQASLEKHGLEIPFPQRDLHVKSPQIEQLTAKIDRWLELQTPAPVRLYYPNGSQAINHYQDTLVKSIEAESPNSDLDLLTEEIDLDSLIAQMRSAEGLQIKDRRYGLKTFRNCFVGSEAVKWFMLTQKATQIAAIQIGQLLIDRGIVHHVLDEHGFKDEFLFYRFYMDEVISNK